MVNLYEALGLPNFASIAEVKAAFKKLALQYHPDRNPGDPQAEEKFKAINHAYQCLSNPEKKARYDNMLRLGYQPRPVVFYRPQWTWTPPMRRRPRPRPMSPQEQAEYERYLKAAPWIAIAFVGYMFFIVYSVFDFIGRVNYYWAYQAYQEGDYLAAEHYLTQGLTTDPYYFRALFLRGKIYIEYFGFYEQGRNFIQAAIDNAPISSPEFYFYRAVANAHLQKADSARIDFLYAFNQMPTDKQKWMRAAVLLLYTSQSPPEAKVILQEMIRRGMADEAVYANLGIIANAEENYAAEVEAYSKAILCNPRNGEWYYRRAWAYVNLTQLGNACRDWNVAKKLNRRLRDESLDYFCESYITSQLSPSSETPNAN